MRSAAHKDQQWISTQLIQVAVFLAAAAIAAPLGRTLRMGSVLGYLAAGVIIGLYILGRSTSSTTSKAFCSSANSAS